MFKHLLQASVVPTQKEAVWKTLPKAQEKSPIEASENWDWSPDCFFFFFSFCETHGQLLNISTIKHQNANTKPMDLSRGASAGQNEKVCPLQKDKSRMEALAGPLRLLAYY